MMQNINLNQINNSKVLVKVCYDLSNFQEVDRIMDSYATIRQLLNQNNQVIILSHWKRPEGKDKELSLKKMQSLISDNLQVPIEFIDQFETGFENTKEQIQNSANNLFLLENTRFDIAENSKDETERLKLAKQYAILGQYLVDEAFAVSHRQEATNTELAELLPSCLGLAYQNEVKVLSDLIKNPNRPFIAVMAGAKLETKLPLIEKMLSVADQIIVGGMLAFTFIKAAQNLQITQYQNVDIADSKIEPDFIVKAETLLKNFENKLILPIDFNYEQENQNLKLALDIGQQSIQKFIQILASAKTIFMNGTMGYYEKPPFNQGTLAIAEFLSLQKDKFIAIGGGDTNSALPANIQANFNFVSMGGGATLEFLAGGYNYQKNHL